jgi:hypothetical protein
MFHSSQAGRTPSSQDTQNLLHSWGCIRRCDGVLWWQALPWMSQQRQPGCQGSQPSRSEESILNLVPAGHNGMKSSGRKLSLHQPATYRIRVQGQLDESWSPRMGGMAISTTTTVEQGPVATLEGRLLDQAALAGVLDALYSLCLPVISVEYVPVGSEGRSALLDSEQEH